MKKEKYQKVKLITVGSDPEVFIMDKNTKETISAEGLIGGTKESPIFLEEGYGIQEDNILAEITIPPARCSKEFVQNINKSLELIKSRLPSALGVKISASEIVSKEYLISEQAITFGCSPDFNAYTLKENSKPKAKNKNLRTSGMHIHLGLELESPENEEDTISFNTKAYIVRYMDLFLGLPSIILDTDKRRRELYGKAGAFRPKPYGLEYRTLSGFFYGNEEYSKWIFKACQEAIYSYNNEQLISEEFKMVANIINSGNIAGAEKIIQDFQIDLPKLQTIKL